MRVDLCEGYLIYSCGGVLSSIPNIVLVVIID